MQGPGRAKPRARTYQKPWGHRVLTAGRAQPSGALCGRPASVCPVLRVTGPRLQIGRAGIRPLDPGTLSSGLRAVEQVVLNRATLGWGQVASGPSGKTTRKEAVAGGDAGTGEQEPRRRSRRPLRQASGGRGVQRGAPHPQGASDHALPESSAGTRHKARPQEPDTSLGFLSAPGSLLKRHHRQEAGSGMCHLGAAACDVVCLF